MSITINIFNTRVLGLILIKNFITYFLSLTYLLPILSLVLDIYQERTLL